MKGVVETISALLISAVLISVVGTVYFWGLPLIQKNKDVSVLEGTEDFMHELNNRIKLVANLGGTEQLQFNQPGMIRFDGSTIQVALDTEGTIYFTEAPVPLSRNNPSISAGLWGADEPEVIYVTSTSIGGSRYNDKFTLRYIPLEVNPDPVSTKEFHIELYGVDSVGGQGDNVILTNEGTSQETTPEGKTIVKTRVKVSVE